MKSRLLALLCAGFMMACPSSKPPVVPTVPVVAPAATSSVVSSDILSREPVANSAEIKHILISWRELGEAMGGRQDARAQARSKAEAEALVQTLLTELKGGGNFEALMKEHSEDTGSAQANKAFTVTPDAGLVIEFRQLGLRLNLNEVGVCQSDFGFHIMKRLK